MIKKELREHTTTHDRKVKEACTHKRVHGGSPSSCSSPIRHNAVQVLVRELFHRFAMVSHGVDAPHEAEKYHDLYTHTEKT